MLHDIETGEVAQDGDEIGHNTPLANAQFEKRPPLVATIKVDEEGGQQDGEEIDDGQDKELIGWLILAQIAQEEQGHETQKRQIKRGEDNADNPCRKYNLLFSCHLLKSLIIYFFLRRATGMPICSRYFATVRRAMS